MVMCNIRSPFPYAYVSLDEVENHGQARNNPFSLQKNSSHFPNLSSCISHTHSLTHSLCYPHLIKHGTEAPAGKVMLMHRILGFHVCEIEIDRLHPLLFLSKFVSSQRRWLTVVCLFACFLEHSSASGSIIQRTWVLSPVFSHLLAGIPPLKNPAPFFKLVHPPCATTFPRATTHA